MVDVVGNMLYQRKQEITVKGIKKKDNSLFFDEDDGNSIKTFDEFSYDGAEFHVDEDPRKYVADKLKLPMENVHFDDEI